MQHGEKFETFSKKCQKTNVLQQDLARFASPTSRSRRQSDQFPAFSRQVVQGPSYTDSIFQEQVKTRLPYVRTVRLTTLPMAETMLLVQDNLVKVKNVPTSS